MQNGVPSHGRRLDNVVDFWGLVWDAGASKAQRAVVS